METIRAELFHYNTETDVNSTELIPVYLFDEEVCKIELGLIVRYINAFEKNNNRMAPPVSNFLIGQLYKTRGIDLDSTKDVRRLIKDSANIFGKDIKSVFIDIIKDYIDAN